MKLPYKNIIKNGDATLKLYYASVGDYRSCPIKQQCCKNSRFKQLTSTIDKSYYDAAHKLLNTRHGKRMIQLRSATVEPVLGTLLTFRRMKKVYTIGQDLAHKQLLMAAATYNLKKLMNAMGFFRRGVKAAVSTVKNAFRGNICIYRMVFSLSHAKI